jgi:hypothetical protein
MINDHFTAAQSSPRQLLWVDSGLSGRLDDVSLPGRSHRWRFDAHTENPSEIFTSLNKTVWNHWSG